eukprot:g47974.t1
MGFDVKEDLKEVKSQQALRFASKVSKIIFWFRDRTVEQDEMEVFDDNMQETLHQPLSLDDLTKALVSCEKDKTPGSDSLPPEFYSALWDWIGQDLLEVYDSMFLADYKILSKVIANQVRSALGLVVIHPDQTCAVPGRTSPENLTFLRDMITYVQDWRTNYPKMQGICFGESGSCPKTWEDCVANMRQKLGRREHRSFSIA